MNNNVLHQPANTVLDNTKAMVDKEGIEEITSNYSYQFKKPKLDKLSLVNTANNTDGITKSSMAENVDLNNYLNQLEEEICLDLLMLPQTVQQLLVEQIQHLVLNIVIYQ